MALQILVGHNVWPTSLCGLNEKNAMLFSLIPSQKVTKLGLLFSKNKVMPVEGGKQILANSLEDGERPKVQHELLTYNNTITEKNYFLGCLHIFTCGAYSCAATQRHTFFHLVQLIELHCSVLWGGDIVICLNLISVAIADTRLNQPSG